MVTIDMTSIKKCKNIINTKFRIVIALGEERVKTSQVGGSLKSLQRPQKWTFSLNWVIGSYDP
jgi:hypothetical protein